MKINYEYKSYILNSGLMNVYKEFRKDLYKTLSKMSLLYVCGNDLSSKDIELAINGVGTNKFLTAVTQKVLLKYSLLAENIEMYAQCVKLYNSQKQRTNRLKSRVDVLTQQPCLFLTLTYYTNYLNTTTDKQRRTDITRYLKSFNAPYVANKDFGGKNGREHYHAILQVPFIDTKSWKYGKTLFAERIFIDENKDCISKISKYIAKLTNHAIKNTTKRSALIYSR